MGQEIFQLQWGNCSEPYRKTSTRTTSHLSVVLVFDVVEDQVYVRASNSAVNEVGEGFQ